MEDAIDFGDVKFLLVYKSSRRRRGLDLFSRAY